MLVNARSVVHRACGRRFWLAAALLAGSSLIAFQSFQAAGAPSASVTYTRGVLRVTIPYQLPRAGAGRLVVETLTPEDAVLGRVEREMESGARGAWREEMRIAEEPPIDDLAWDRVRWRFTYAGSKSPAAEGTDSISEILRTPVVRVFGQQSFLSGGQAAVRVVVTDSKDKPIVGPASLRVELTPPGAGAHVLFSGRLNRRGTAEAQFRIPAGIVGAVPLRFIVDTPIGSSEYVQQARVEDKISIMLTTEKPIYQPGQTIHARALALDRANHEAAADRNLTFEVEDSRGNKVFRAAARTDRFGVASAEFALAEEVNLGTYHLRARMDGADGSKNSGELALNVEKYVLPKFKVAVDLGGAESKAKRGYRPGDRVTGTVRANYFFGKAVENAEVTINATGMDVAMYNAARVNGKTDAEGAYRFDMQLPRYFAGRPLAQGAARVLIEATVKDAAGHSEIRAEPITVSDSPLLITAVPEGGALARGLENQVFILAAYPDGSPAKAELTVHAAGGDQNVATDESGVAVVALRGDQGPTLRIDARDHESNRATASVDLRSRAGSESILLRAHRAVYRAGDRIDLMVLATKKSGAAYIDVIREGQTVLTRDVDLVNGQAELSLTATPALAGAVDFNAYMFTGGAAPVADHRLAFVQPADELKIEATADRAEYKPGGDARIRFRVTDSKGEGVEAALGLEVVDEAVFALAEKQPGFAKVFFYLEQEVMKPRYEIHSVEMPAVLTTARAGQVQPTGRAGQVQPTGRAAQALFAATEMASPNRFQTQFGGQAPRAKYNEYRARYQAQFQAQLREMADKLNQVYASNPNAGDVPAVAAILAAGGQPEMRDAWGSDLRISRAYNSGYAVPAWQDFTVRSAGPDKQIGTEDDLTGNLRLNGSVSRPNVAGSEGGAQLKIERNIGPMNGLAEITGSVSDPAGAAISGASVQARSVAGAAVRSTAANAEGRFQFAGLPPGEYELRVMCAGFKIFTRRLLVQPRDRAILNVDLAVGAITEEVTVTAAATPVQIMGGALGGLAVNGGGTARANFTVDGVLAPAMPIQTASSENSRLVDRNQVANIATKGRDLMGVLQTIPAAAPEPAGAAPPHVRSYFPEALYINPEIITDASGVASISIPLADSITTWRMAMWRPRRGARWAAALRAIKVFQDFFIELDLPVTLTQGDQVTIPVAVYNYSGSNGDVSVRLERGDWFSLSDGAASQNVKVESGRVSAAQFTIEAKRIGKFKLTLNAAMNAAERADIVVREIEVVPNGREQNVVFNGRLEKSVEHAVNFPAAAVPKAGRIFVRLYPGPLSQVIEGMDSLLRMPFGCFEQTSSATYPNVLALDYMKRTGKLTPEVHAKAEGLHRQRLPAPADVRSARRRVLVVRPGAGEQDPHGVRADGVLRHVAGARRGRERDPAHAAVARRASSRRTEAGSPIRSSSTKAPPTASIPGPCALRRTWRGRLKTRVTAGRRWNARSSSSSGTSARRRTPTRWRWLANFAVDTAMTEASPPNSCGGCWTRAPRRTTRRGGRPRKPASTDAAQAQPWRPRDSPRRRCSSGDRLPARLRKPELHRRQERCRRSVGDHAGHHRGAPRAAALHSRRARRRARHGRDHAQRQAPSKRCG